MASFLRIPPIYPILDTGTLERRGLDPLDAAKALLEGGARILQYRHKTFWSQSAFNEAKQIAELCRQTGALFIINDRADYALYLSDLNAGLHLGQDDLLPADARKVIGPDPIIGFSTHNAAQMEAALTYPVDYVAYGPIFPTTTKERPDPATGIEALREIRTLTTKPLIAIGGITRENAPDCLRAGADSVAIIADLFPDPCTKLTVRERMTELCYLCSSAVQS
jgi:thiamine-phosphate pyrophosphorylase